MLTDAERNEIEEIYKNLYENRNLPAGKHIKIPNEKIQLVCSKSIEFLNNDPMLLQLHAPVNVVGDVHGQFNDAMKYIEIGGDPATTQYLFLGDYVDRGMNSVETITTMLCLKILYPENVYLLRGNHETEDISHLYGFFDECQEFYNEEIWKLFNEVFTYLPLAAIISQRIFCVHGGISQHMASPSIIKDIQRPLREIQEDSYISDLLWADPDPEINGYQASERGTSFTFGSDAADSFLNANDFDLICRAHQVVPDGYEFPFYPKPTVVTIFSAPNYCDFENNGAMLKINEKLNCSFEFVLSPEVNGESSVDRPATPAYQC